MTEPAARMGEEAVTMDEITRRIATLNESLRLFITSWDCRTCLKEREASSAAIDHLRKVIISLGGVITPDTP